MKRKLTLSIAGLCGSLLLMSPYVFSSSTGAPVLNSGAPNEMYCTQCHGEVGIEHSSKAVTIKMLDGTSEVQDYKPGKTYTVEVSIQRAAAKAFGFEASIMNQSENMVGTLSGKAGISKVIGGGKYVTHVNSAAAGTGFDSWTFNWTAPAQSVGDVTIYTALNAANGNGNSLGDEIHTQSKTFSLLNSTLDADNAARLLNVYPNPATNILQVSVALKTAGPVQVGIYDMQGKCLKTEMSLMNNAGHLALAVDIAELQPGLYFLQIGTGSNVHTRKFMKL